jgi:hypothetical protein
MDYSFPTAADYAQSSANDANRKVRELEARVARLEELLKVNTPKRNFKKYPFK